MKIVFLLSNFLPTRIAGTEVYTNALAKSLQQKGHEVTIVIPNYGSQELRVYEYEGLSVKRYAEPDNKDKLLIMGKRAPDGLEAFEKLIRDYNPDIVHVQELAGSSGIGLYHLRVLKKLGIKTIMTMHLSHYSCFASTLMYKGKEHCNGKIDISRCTRCALSSLPINSLSQEIVHNISMPLYNAKIDTGRLNLSVGTAFSYPFIISNLKNKLNEIATLCNEIIVLTDWYKKVLLKNGIAERKLNLIKQALPYESNVSHRAGNSVTLPLRLIFIGRIGPLKGLHLLIDAMSGLEEERVCVDIFGTVTEVDYDDYWRKATINRKNIRWKGTLLQKDIINTISKYDALVLPSTFSEMSPLVIQEAFAANVPVIGSDVAGIAEQIQHDYNGLIFNFNSVGSLRNILYSLTQNHSILPKLRENISKPLDFETVVEQTLAVYTK